MRLYVHVMNEILSAYICICIYIYIYYKWLKGTTVFLNGVPELEHDCYFLFVAYGPAHVFLGFISWHTTPATLATLKLSLVFAQRSWIKPIRSRTCCLPVVCADLRFNPVLNWWSHICDFRHATVCMDWFTLVCGCWKIENLGRRVLKPPTEIVSWNLSSREGLTFHADRLFYLGDVLHPGVSLIKLSTLN